MRERVERYSGGTEIMENTDNNFVVAVITQTVTAGDCLEHTRPAMGVLAFLEIDQTTRNGP